MALYMFFYVVPDDHLDFLKDNPTAFDAYLGGEIPDLSPGLFARLLGKKQTELPGDWPNHELDAYSPEVNHRQVNVFHYLLNATNDPVESAGSLFQTWFKPRHNSPAVVIDGENFAFFNSDAKQLLKLVESVTPAMRRDRLAHCEDVSKARIDSDSADYAFDVIEKACSEAVSKGQGLLWTNR